MSGSNAGAEGYAEGPKMQKMWYLYRCVVVQSKELLVCRAAGVLGGLLRSI